MTSHAASLYEKGWLGESPRKLLLPALFSFPPPPCFGILVWKWVADGLHGVLVAVQQVSSCSTLWVHYSNKISHGYICHLFGLLNKQFFTTPWCWVSCCLIYRSLPLLSSRFLLKLLIPREWTNVCVLRDKDWQVGTHEVALLFCHWSLFFWFPHLKLDCKLWSRNSLSL